MIRILGLTLAALMVVTLVGGGTYAYFSDTEWCYFSEVITDSQYFKTNFRLRFDGSALTNPSEAFILDDVFITTQ